MAVANRVILQPAVGLRSEITIGEGLSVADIVRLVMPGALPVHLDRTAVVLVSASGKMELDRRYWHLIRPRTGVSVVINTAPAGDFLKPLLQLVVTIAGTLLGGPLGAGLAGTLGLSSGVWGAVIGIGISIAGNLLLNALFPPPSPPDAAKPTYAISGWRNRYAPDAPIPDVYGRHRFAPPYAVMSHMEIQNDQQYVVAVFCYGYGPVSFSDHKIGETPVSKYDEIEMQVREGNPGDGPLSLVPNQVLEDVIGTELTRPLPRDDAGNVIDDQPGIATPVTRFTATDVSQISVIISFPAGLITYDRKGRERVLWVDIDIRHRLVGTSEWTVAAHLYIEAKKKEAFYRQFTWSVPVRGRYEVEITRSTDERTDSNDTDRTILGAIQSIRPEYGINFEKPLALVAIRVKATHQLSGTLETFNSVVARRCLDWDHATGTWILRATRNPASLFRLALQGPSAYRPVSDAEIDLAALSEWHEWCAAKGLHYDKVHDFEASQADALVSIAAAGRASPRYDGRKWSVTIDRPQSLVVDHINSRNSRNFQWSRSYNQYPHGLRVQFLDETNDWQAADRIVRWPGYTGDITVTEQIELPGKTNPDEVWRETRRRMYEMMHRTDRFTAIQDGTARTATRGDLVMGAFDSLSSTSFIGRVSEIRPHFIRIDDPVTMLAGETYAIRFKVAGSSIVRQIVNRPGETDRLTLVGTGVMPDLDSVIHFGPLATESIPLIVAAVEPAEDMAVVYHMVPAASIIDELADADVAPAWSGRVGAEIDTGASEPAVPKFAQILTGIDGTGTSGGLRVSLQAGSAGAARTARFVVGHRLFGASAWTELTVEAASSGASITGYAQGSVVQLRVKALAPSNVASAWSSVATVTIGAGDGSTPSALPSSVTLSGGLGYVSLNFATGSDSATEAVQIYRSTSTMLDRGTDAIGSPVPVSPNTSYGRTDGDITRENMLLNASFASASAWTAGTNWTVSGGFAAHTAGTASDLTQSLALISGRTYRYALTSDVTSGGLSAALLGSGAVVSGSSITASGRFRGKLVANSGSDQFAITGTSAFAGAVDDILLFEETPQCVPQGTLYYWLEPQNANGIPGPVSGPWPVNVY